MQELILSVWFLYQRINIIIPLIFFLIFVVHMIYTKIT